MRASLLLAAWLLTAATAAAQSAPSLAEIARRTEAQRAAGKPASKVYTNASLSPVAEVTVTAATAPPAVGFVSKSTGQVLSAEEIIANSQAQIAVDRQHMGESHWRTRAVGVRADRDRARQRVSDLESAPPARTPGLRQAAVRELERARATLATAERRWAELEESARYANVPKAWLEP